MATRANHAAVWNVKSGQALSRRSALRTRGGLLIALLFSGALVHAQLRDGLPSGFSSRDAAGQAGCQFEPVEGSAHDTCVLVAFTGSEADVGIYERGRGNRYGLAHRLAVPSQYWETSVSYVESPGADAEWMAVETNGATGTGIHHRILLLLAWDGGRFRPRALESLDYRCYRPTTPSDFALDVQQAFAIEGGAASIRLHYDLRRDDVTLASWSDALTWNGERSTFESRGSAPPLVDPLAVAVGERIERVRAYVRERSAEASDDLRDWVSPSGVMDVLAPVGC